MNDIQKVGRVELALRTEALTLRESGGPGNIQASKAIDDYLSKAGIESKLRFGNILLAR